MKRLALAAVLVSASFGVFAMDTPESLVRAFMADYRDWNDRAMALDEKVGSLEAMDAAERDYALLLRKYAPPGFSGEPIAYGSRASHDPAHETIASVTGSDTGAVVRTEAASPSGLKHAYEYELTRKDGRWYLTQVHLVDEDGRYPGL